MSESMKDIDEQAFWSPCQIKAPQDMVLRIAAQATGRQYGGYWTNPPLPEGEIQENQRMEAAVAAVKNRKEKSEWCGIHSGWRSCCGCPSNQPSNFSQYPASWEFGQGVDPKGDRPLEWNGETWTPCEDLFRKKQKEREEKFQVLREPPYEGRRLKSLPLEGPNPGKRKVQNQEGHRVRTGSEPEPPRRRERRPMEPAPPPPQPLEPLQGPQPLPQEIGRAHV